ncbi:hypothetical protein [Victivallis sp. Marseille-Q1083]|uniref:hypothetical protein n=1 Tax=Victivallis sp. Marseille-Q1083 TaxID=2717288 RepID=UPI0015893149|nr:hypothetical protein [Victivallis sp. Marseille-Q1083]
MITIEKAFELAQKANVTGISLSRTADETADYWCFYYDTDDVLIGPRPVAVNKKDGKVWGVFYPEHADELDNAKKIEVPGAL